ncbi:G-protein coupled receptor 54-like [Branchiostoma floridae x Branchiostoma japonicum]
MSRPRGRGPLVGLSTATMSSVDVSVDEANMTDFFNATLDALLPTESSNQSWVPDDDPPRAPPVLFAVERQVIPVVFGLICLVGMVGNILVILVVSKSSDMKTVTNYYIVNLAITDLAFLVCCVPFVATSFALGPSWVFGAFACKAVFYIIRVTLQATCLTLMALSIDRFCAIVLPFKSIDFRRPRVAIFVSVCIWIGSFLLSIPVALRHRIYMVGDQVLCRERWPSATAQQSYMIYMVSITYIIPLATSIFCGAMIVRQVCNRPESANLGGQSQTRKVTIMIIGVVLLFALSWLPNHAINLWRVMNPRAPGSIPLYQFKFAAMCLSYANSAMNPFVYTFVGENFRVELHKLFQNLCSKCWYPYSADSKKAPASAKGSNTSFKTAVTLTRSASGGIGQCETLPFRPVTPLPDEVYCPVVVVKDDTKMSFETNI